MDILIVLLGIAVLLLLLRIFKNKREGYYLQDLPNGFGGWPPKIYAGKNKEFVNGQEIDFAPPPAMHAYDMYGEPAREGELGYSAGLGYTW